MPNLQDGAEGVIAPSFRLNKDLLLELIELRPSYKYHVQLVRSMAVSVLALAVNFSVSFILKDWLSVFYLLAASASYCAGVAVNYYLSVKWVFALRRVQSPQTEFLIFLAINLLGLALNAIIITAMVGTLKTNYWLALSAATAIVFFWNFLARKKILY